MNLRTPGKTVKLSVGKMQEGKLLTELVVPFSKWGEKKRRVKRSSIIF